MRAESTKSAVRQSIPHVVDAKIVGPYALELVFDDGLHKTLDLESHLHGEVFEPLRDPGFFAQMTVDPVAGTVVWPNGADFAPEFLYEWTPEAEGEATPWTADGSAEPLIYLVVFEKSNRGYSAYAPDLPGCVATGATPDEARQRMRETIALHVEASQKRGEPLPEARAWSEFLDL